MKLPSLGRIKFISERLKGYLVWVSSAMMLDLWVSSRGVSWWYAAPAIFCLCVALWAFDKRFVAPDETSSAATINPEWNRLVRMVEQINEKKKEDLW